MGTTECFSHAGTSCDGERCGNDAQPAVTDTQAVTDTRLVEAVRAGDQDAFGVLYGRNREPGLRHARRLLSSVQDAEDVLHEAFTKTVNAIRNGAGPKDGFTPYLMTAIRSVANTYHRKRALEPPAGDDDLDFCFGPLEDPALDRALAALEHDRIAEAMRSLPERWRLVLWHAEVAGMKPRDLGPLLGVAPNAASALLIRARTGLKAAYEQLLNAAADGTTGRANGQRRRKCGH
jgi:RNA polymerase sigma factor (sigma-70 family)